MLPVRHFGISQNQNFLTQVCMIITQKIILILNQIQCKNVPKSLSNRIGYVSKDNEKIKMSNSTNFLLKIKLTGRIVHVGNSMATRMSSPPWKQAQIFIRAYTPWLWEK